MSRREHGKENPPKFSVLTFARQPLAVPSPPFPGGRVLVTLRMSLPRVSSISGGTQRAGQPGSRTGGGGFVSNQTFGPWRRANVAENLPISPTPAKQTQSWRGPRVHGEPYLTPASSERLFGHHCLSYPGPWAALGHEPAL